jgi:hypothetical protein
MQQPIFPPYAPGLADAGAEIAQLRRVLALVAEMAGAAPDKPDAAALDEAARIGAAYACALPIDQRRFDEHAATTARWAAAGVEALLRLTERGWPTRAAAERLARELRTALTELGRIVSA